MSEHFSCGRVLRALLKPLSYDAALDPFSVKKLSKFHPCRLAWTIQSRLIERRAHRCRKPFAEALDAENILHLFTDRGDAIPDTAVTTRQMELLELVLEHSDAVAGDVVEVGSYRGVTTIHLARKTLKAVYAVDPFIGYGGSASDLSSFKKRVDGIGNIVHLRKTSGGASESFEENSLSMAFIDAVHDVSNSWFDFVTWSKKVKNGGFMAMHDVDDFPGVGLTCRLAQQLAPKFTVWGYCPNLVVFQKGGVRGDSGDVSGRSASRSAYR